MVGECERRAVGEVAHLLDRAGGENSHIFDGELDELQLVNIRIGWTWVACCGAGE